MPHSLPIESEATKLLHESPLALFASYGRWAAYEARGSTVSTLVM